MLCFWYWLLIYLQYYDYNSNSFENELLDNKILHSDYDCSIFYKKNNHRKTKNSIKKCQSKINTVYDNKYNIARYLHKTIL